MRETTSVTISDPSTRAVRRAVAHRGGKTPAGASNEFHIIPIGNPHRIDPDQWPLRAAVYQFHHWEYSLMQLQQTRPDSSETDRVHHLLTQIKKHRWLGQDAEAEKLAAELARLQPGATKIEPPDTD